MRKLLLLLCCILLTNCEEKDNNLPIRKPYNSHRFERKDSEKIIWVNSAVMLESDPLLVNMNFRDDTLNVGFRGRIKEESFGNDTILPRYDLKIIIDTTSDFYSNGFDYERRRWIAALEKEKGNAIIDPHSPAVTEYFNHIDSVRKKTLYAHKVLIYNRGKSNAYVYTGHFKFPMIQEAMDVDGVWKPIEFQFNRLIYVCGPPSIFYEIAPTHYAVIATMKYHGSFKTKIRMKIRSENQTYYSNEITGFINRSQFDQTFLKAYLSERHTQEEMDFYNFEDHKKRAFLDLNYKPSSD